MRSSIIVASRLLSKPLMIPTRMQPIAFLIAGLVVLAGCVPAVRFRGGSAAAVTNTSNAKAAHVNDRMRGRASYYHDAFDGRLTASGEPFRQDQLTAAHRWLPFGTLVRVTNLQNKRSVVVRITDRGPFVEGRILDLSRAAAEQLGMLDTGVADVELIVVDLPQ